MSLLPATHWAHHILGLGFRVPKDFAWLCLAPRHPVPWDVCGSNHSDRRVRITVLIFIFSHVRQGSKKTGEVFTSSFQARSLSVLSPSTTLLFLGSSWRPSLKPPLVEMRVAPLHPPCRRSRLVLPTVPLLAGFLSFLSFCLTPHETQDGVDVSQRSARDREETKEPTLKTKSPKASFKRTHPHKPSRVDTVHREAVTWERTEKSVTSTPPLDHTHRHRSIR